MQVQDSKKMRLIGVWSPPGSHVAGWRQPASPDTPEELFSFKNYLAVAKMAEAACMDALFLADTNQLPTANLVEKADPAAEGSGRILRFDAVSTIAALASATSRIGLIATATTTYNEPYTMARKIGTIDLISVGRAGWNMVTTQTDSEALNYNRDEHVPHAKRYERAEEFLDVVTGLWDCWEDDALVMDKASSRFSDVSKMRVLNHKGPHFKVQGPLNIQRSPQGRPVICQAGSSGPGRELAAQYADVIFLANSSKEDCKAFRDDIRARAKSYGRNPDEIKVMPGIMPLLGRTMPEAKAHYQRMHDSVTDEEGLVAMRRISEGIDLRKYPMDGPMPELPPTNGATARQKIVMDWARQEKLTLRETARRFAETDGHNLIWGTPESVSDLMQDWFEAGACDGFCVLFPYFPTGVENFTEWVVPELQRRKLFRAEYEGRTLRENLGVPVPARRLLKTVSES